MYGTLVDASRRRIAVGFETWPRRRNGWSTTKIRNSLASRVARAKLRDVSRGGVALWRGSAASITGEETRIGKSTMTAAAVTRGFETAGDNYCMIETDGTPCAHAVFDTIKLDERGLAEFPQFRPFIRNATRRGRRKAITHLYDAARVRIAADSASGDPVCARLTGERQSRIVASTRAAAYLALDSLHDVSAARGEPGSRARCAALVDSLNAYAFEIGTDSVAAVAELSAFMRARV